MKIYRIEKEAQQEYQDPEGYFMGNVPDYATNMLGSSSVDASQIQSAFSNVDDALRLVNQFDGSLLQNISFIFNFTKDGAYGVYLDSLDKAIKTKALQQALEREGYTIHIDENNSLTAYPQDGEEVSGEQISSDINRLYSQIESQGGAAFGINMSKVLNAAQQDAARIGSPDPDIFKWIAILHLGGTIVHEAVHAKGNHGEGPSESAEANFMEWALPNINQEYSNSYSGDPENFVELTMGQQKMGAGNNWYKKAQQLSHYTPPASFNRPTGSDLGGRFPIGPQSNQGGRAGWGMLSQEDQSVPIEKKLGRQFMSPLPPDLDQGKDSLELQLRKYTRDDMKLDPKASTEELLSEGHVRNVAYEHTETLLEDMRPVPLMVPIDKAASNHKTIKVATTFGWMNNLEISDGSTIPGLGDRVMSWEDSEEDFGGAEDDVRSQPRYNPEYDIKGFYYRFIEPRDKPQLWDNMSDDGYSGTSPAKRFASTDSAGKIEVDEDLSKIMHVLTSAKTKVKNGDIKATRLVMTDDVYPLAQRLLNADASVNMTAFHIGNSDGDKIYSVWLYNPQINADVIRHVESVLNKNDDDADINDLLEELFGIRAQKEKIIQEIVSKAKSICKQYQIKDVFIAGGYPRAIAMKHSIADVNDLDFSGAWPNQSLKVGGLLAEALGVTDIKIFHRTMTLSFSYKGVKIDFKGNYTPIEIRHLMREENLKTTPLNLDVYGRDFTINMFIYDLMEGRVFDICGCSEHDVVHKEIRTFFDPDYICSQNPLVILRALKFHLRYGFSMDIDLQKAMIVNVPLLFDGRYTEERLALGRNEVLRENRTQALKLFDDFGLHEFLKS